MDQSILFVGSAFDDFAGCLAQKGVGVKCVDNFERAADFLIESQVDLLVVNLDASGDGAGFIRRMRRIPTLSRTRVLAVGAWGSGQPTLALSSGADAYEPTPTDSQRLIDAVERILNQRVAIAGMSE